MELGLGGLLRSWGGSRARGWVSGGTSELRGLRESGETGEGDVGPAPSLGAGGASGRRAGGERRHGRVGRAQAWRGALEFEARQEGCWQQAGWPREG